MTDDEVKAQRVRVVDPEHPHFGESGNLTGKIISVLGTSMAEVKLTNCEHGTDGCFVAKGQIDIERRSRR